MLFYGEIRYGNGIWGLLFDFWFGLKQNEFVRRSASGFTLMELLLVIALIGILSVIGIGSFTQATVKSKDTQRKNDLNQISKALELFNNDIKRYPYDDGSGNMTCPGITGAEGSCGNGLLAYILGVEAVYMRDVPKDPVSGTAYYYDYDEDTGGFALYARLDNLEDRDVVETTDAEGNTEKTDWGINCGSGNCNYKLTELGLIRVIPTPTP